MGLELHEIEILARLAAGLRQPLDVLSFGHPDILATPGELYPVLGKTMPVDNEEVRNQRNGIPGENIVGNARPVFEAMGGKLKVADAIAASNVDIQFDLNRSPDFQNKYLGEFQIVIDPGTSEHIFNVARALGTMAECVALGGFIYHMVPMASWNHGYWNFSPIVFTEFYCEKNGFRIIDLKAIKKRKWVEVDRHKKFSVENDGKKLNLMCLAERISESTALFPEIQGKYLRRINRRNAEAQP